MFDTDAVKAKAEEIADNNSTLVAAAAGASSYGLVLLWGFGSTIGP